LGGLYRVCAVARGDGAVDVVDLEYELATAKIKRTSSGSNFNNEFKRI
jgi:hypothetical protein